MKKTMDGQWMETGFELSNGTTFTICHNMPETLGLSIQDAFQNWIARTNKYTDNSFVAYIDSKNTGFYAMTKRIFDIHNTK